MKAKNEEDPRDLLSLNTYIDKNDKLHCMTCGRDISSYQPRGIIAHLFSHIIER